HTRSYGDWSSDVCSSDLALSSRLWIPVAFRLLAFASWAFVSRCGIPPFLRRAYRQTAGPQRGFHVPHGGDTTGVDAIYTPGPWCPHVTSFRSHAQWPRGHTGVAHYRRVSHL